MDRWHRSIGITLLLAFFTPLLSFAQVSRETTTNTHFWTSINSTIRAADNWGAVADVHIRRSGFLNTPNFYFIRFGGAYFLDTRFSIAAGYAHLWLNRETDAGLQFANENRTYQQVLWRARIERTTFLQRIRTEQRWQEVISQESGGVEKIRFTNRIRFLFSTSFQVFRDPMLPKLVLADEVHIHFGEDVIYNTFNQNRIFLGISQRISKNVTFDLGYMHVYQQRFTGNQYDSNHTFRLFFYYTPDFRKKRDEDFPHFPFPGDE